MAKFSKLGEEPEPFDYGDVFFRQPCGTSERLVIGPSSQQVALLCDLAQPFASETYWVLYVLLVSHVGNEPGRYCSPEFETFEDLELFLWTFQTFFEGDGRHHVWVASAESDDLLVYDQHNVIFAYGSLDEFEELLLVSGFNRQKFWFPAPHVHSFDRAWATTEKELIASMDWTWSPLQKGDDWD